MGLVTNENRFEQYKKKLEEQRNQSRSSDGRIVDLKVNPKPYRFRLLYIEEPKGSLRKGPFIKKNEHRGRNADNRFQTITCPTTFDRFDYDSCKVCKNNGTLMGSTNPIDQNIYKTFKRGFVGFAAVYVVSDPVTPENNGHVKILKFKVEIDKFLNKEIFNQRGKPQKDDNGNTIPDDSYDDAELVGFNAFKLKAGFDLIVEVEQQGDWPKYKPKFSRNTTDINADMEVLEKEIEDLKFDDLLQRSSNEEIDNFFNNCVLHTMNTTTGMTRHEDSSSDSAQSQENSDLQEDVENMVEEMMSGTSAQTEEAPSKPAPAKEEKKVEKKAEKKEEKKEEAPAKPAAAPAAAPAPKESEGVQDVSDEDLDALMNEIMNESK